MKAKLGISLKVTAIVLLVSSIFVSLLVYMNMEEQKSFFEKTYADKAIVLAKSLDSGIGSREELNDKEKLQARAYKLVWENPEILKISINLPEGEILKTAVSSDSGSVGAFASPQNYASYKNDSTYREIGKIGNVQAITIITPVHLSGQRVGTYEMALSMSSINDAIASQARKLIMLAVADFIIFIVVMVFLLDISIVRPIKQIISGVETIGKGNLEYKIPVSSNDEMGRLASVFNQMTDELKKSRESLGKHAEELEKQVGERTKELEEKVSEMERFNKMAVGRELKMIELKKRIAELEGKNKT